MSWIQKLYDTYEFCSPMIDVSTSENEEPLLPICHMFQNAQIEITIDSDGNFMRADFVPKASAKTLIPCTEKSGGRTSGEAAHPLCDKLQYVANDYAEYGGKKDHYFDSYNSKLQSWCESSNAHPKAQAILKYVQHGHVIEDLVAKQVLFLGENGKLLEKWDKKVNKNAPDGRQDEAFVRWIVWDTNELQPAVWKDSSLQESWIKYYTGNEGNKGFCFVTGETNSLAAQHPRNIRRSGDGAKLISSNDKAGFTYRGRFETADQACSIGYDATQKAHNALRWLIGRQGKVFYNKRDLGLTIVSWATSGKPIPDPMDDYFDLMGMSGLQENTHITDTAQDASVRLGKLLSGYNAELGDTAEIVVMGLDSASPGRMAIIYYRELKGSDFLNKIERWHKACCWVHRYRGHCFIGAPAPKDIVEASYGVKVDDNLRRATIQRILPCIVDGRKVPEDIVRMSIRKASNRIGQTQYEWGKTLSIACALYRKYCIDYKGEVLDMALDETRKTRDYLYGRLLAVADLLEQRALKKAGEKRETNAARYMQKFSERPFSTWRTIEHSMSPYKARLGNSADYYAKCFDEIMALFISSDDYMSDKRLSGEYLLGYHCQREKMLTPRNAQTKDIENNNEEEN